MDKYDINHISSRTLDNGLQIYVNERQAAPVVSVQIWVETGSIHEEEYLGCGLSHFLEHMLFHGSAKFSGDNIVDTVHRLGGDMNAYTSLGHTVYYIELPSRHVLTAIDILADMVAYPAFPEDKFADEKNIILRERDMHGDNPSRFMSEKLWHEMFKVHPAKHPIIGYREKILSVNRDMMADYHRRRYSPERSFCMISGMVDPKEVFDAVTSRLDKWERGGLQEAFMPVEPPQLSLREAQYIFNDPLARMSLSWHIPPSGHPDIPALDILCAIMGQNKSSRLVDELKIRRNLAVEVSSFSFTPSFCGILGISLLAEPAKLPDLERTLQVVVENTRSGTFTQNELKREVTQLSTEYLRALRSNSSIVRILGNSILSYGSAEYVHKYLDDLDHVTVEDLQRVAIKYLPAENSTIMRVVPPDFETQSSRTANPAARVTGHEPLLVRFPGGQRLVKYRESSLPLIDFVLVVPGGVFYENPNNGGITALLSQLLTTGTASYSEMEFLNLLDDNAIEFGVIAGNNSLSIKINCHKERFALAMGLLRGILTEPSLGNAEFLRERKNLVEKLRSRATSPQGIAEDRMLQLLYGSHPYAIPRFGSAATMEKIKLKEVREFYRNTCFNPEQAVFGISGDFDDRAIKEVEALIQAVPWKPGPVLPVKPPVFPETALAEQLPNQRSQAVVMTALPGCDNLSPDRYIIDVLQSAMNGQGSNIFKKIREDAGLAYYTGMVSSRGFHRGYISLYAGTSPEGAAQTAELIREEQLRLATSGLNQDEFEAAMAGLAHSNAEQMENPGSLLTQSCLAEYYGNGIMEPFRAQEVYDRISMDEANAVIRRYMSASNTVQVISMPEKNA